MDLGEDPGQGTHQIRPVAQIHDGPGVAERQGQGAAIEACHGAVSGNHGMQDAGVALQLLQNHRPGLLELCYR